MGLFVLLCRSHLMLNLIVLHWFHLISPLWISSTRGIMDRFQKSTISQGFHFFEKNCRCPYIIMFYCKPLNIGPTLYFHITCLAGTVFPSMALWTSIFSYPWLTLGNAHLLASYRAHSNISCVWLDNQHKLHIQIASKVQCHCNVTGSWQGAFYVFPLVFLISMVANLWVC
jgi:hypothetical protein